MDKNATDATVIHGGDHNEKSPAVPASAQTQTATNEHQECPPHDQIRQISVQSGSVIVETRPDAIVIHRGGNVQCEGNILTALGNHIANHLADTDLSSLELEQPEEGFRKEEKKEETQPLVSAQMGCEACKPKSTGAGLANDMPDTGQGNGEHVGGVIVPQSQTKMCHISVQADSDLTNLEQEQPDGLRMDEQKEETQPLVAEQAGGKARKTKASGTGLAHNIPDTDLHNREDVGRINVAQTQSKMRHISVQAGSVIVGIMAMLLPSFWLSVLISYLLSLVPGSNHEAFNEIGQNNATELPNLNK